MFVIFDISCASGFGVKVHTKLTCCIIPRDNRAGHVNQRARKQQRARLNEELKMEYIGVHGIPLQSLTLNDCLNCRKHP